MAYPIKAIPKLFSLPCYAHNTRKVLHKIEHLQVAQERAEGPKALSPGQRPGYTRSQQCAL